MVSAPEVFDRQFVVSTVERPCRESWRCRPLGDLFVYLAPSRNAISVTDADGMEIGLLIGTPIDLERQMIVT